MDVRTRLNSLFIFLGVLLLFPIEVFGSPRYLSGNLSEANNQTQPARIQFAISTPLGRERFFFTNRSNTAGDRSGAHYVGYSSLGSGEQRGLPASLSVSRSEARLFFISRRTGRAAALIFRFSGQGSVLVGPLSRVHRFENLPCKRPGSSAPRISSSLLGYRSAAVNETLSIAGVGSTTFLPPRVVDISTYTDPEFAAIHGGRSQSYVQATLDAASSIYMAQVGVQLRLRSMQLAGVASRSSRSYEAEQILEIFRTTRIRPSGQTDLHHLFTGKSFEDSTIGLAYVGSVCEARGAYSVGLSKSVKPALQPLVFAHEIAHGLGANHDSEPFSIMNPAISVTNTNFSVSAGAEMRAHIEHRGQCLAPMATPVVSLTLRSSESIFSAQVSIQPWIPGRCAVRLLARPERPARGKTKRSSITHWRTLTTKTLEVQAPGIVCKADLTTALPLAFSKTNDRYLFRTVVTCGATRASSPSQAFSPSSGGTGALSAANTTDWLTGLTANFRGVAP